MLRIGDFVRVCVEREATNDDARGSFVSLSSTHDGRGGEHTREGALTLFGVRQVCVWSASFFHRVAKERRERVGDDF